jgi:hypothetical protein
MENVLTSLAAASASRRVPQLNRRNGEMTMRFMIMHKNDKHTEAGERPGPELGSRSEQPVLAGVAGDLGGGTGGGAGGADQRTEADQISGK